MSSAKSASIRLGHMLDEIDAISAATRGMTAQAVRDDYLTMRAVERAVQIVSEAAKELPPDVRNKEPEVPWPDVIGIGNLLRHEYYRIDADLIQAILFEHFPKLRPVLIRLLSQYQA